MSDMNVQTVGGESPARTAGAVALEIRTLQSQARGIILSYAIEIGRRLEEAKSMLPHGEWGAWLKRELDYSQSAAQNFMRVYREYGDSQQSLFGGVPKSHAFGNLTFSKALSLLAIPDEEERAQFAVKNDVEHMSTRELNEALKARDKAQKEADAAQEEAASLREETQRLQDALRETESSANAAAEEHTRLCAELEELRNRTTEADTAAVEAARKTAVKEMTEKVNKAKDAKKKADEKRKAAEDALAAAQAELNEWKSKEPEVRELTQEEKDALTADAVNRVKAEGVEQIRSLEKKLAAADPNVAEFKVLFTDWQETYGKLMRVLEHITQTDAERSAGLRRAVKTALEQMADI